MDLWIRSQDKMTLSKARDLRLFELNKKWCIVVIWNNDRDQLIYAKYSTKEKALKVLDEIQNKLIGASKIILQPHQNLSMLSYKDFEKVSNRAKEELRQDIGVLSNLFDYSVANQETIVYEMPADEGKKQNEA